MRSKLPFHHFAGFCLAVSLICLAGCVRPIPSSASNITPLPKSIETAAASSLAIRIPSEPPIPNDTPTLASSLQPPQPIPLSDICQTSMNGLSELTQNLELPQHFSTANPFRQDSDFDPNRYFDVLTHLDIQPGYQLDYIYFKDTLGGKPLIYARKTSAAPFKTYADFLQSYGEKTSSNQSYNLTNHAFDYLQNIDIDPSEEGYFQFVTLALLADQYYLTGSGLYNDTQILCGIQDLDKVTTQLKEIEQVLPKEIIDQAKKIDYTPSVQIENDKVTIRFVTFTKWGGFGEMVFVLNPRAPSDLKDVYRKVLVEYDCGHVY